MKRFDIETKDYFIKLTLVAIFLVAAMGTMATMEVVHHRRKAPRLILKGVRITAYCTCPKCCGKFSDGITADGTEAKGRIIAAPGIIPFGTKMRIPGYGGIAEVHDRGGAIKGNRLDLLFSDHKAALEWGVQVLDVEVFIN